MTSYNILCAIAMLSTTSITIINQQSSISICITAAPISAPTPPSKSTTSTLLFEDNSDYQWYQQRRIRRRQQQQNGNDNQQYHHRVRQHKQKQKGGETSFPIDTFMTSTRKYGGEGKNKFTWAPGSTKKGNGKKKSNNKKHTSSPSDTLSSASADSSSSAEDQRFLISTVEDGISEDTKRLLVWCVVCEIKWYAHWMLRYVLLWVIMQRHLYWKMNKVS